MLSLAAWLLLNLSATVNLERQRRLRRSVGSLLIGLLLMGRLLIGSLLIGSLLIGSLLIGPSGDSAVRAAPAEQPVQSTRPEQSKAAELLRALDRVRPTTCGDFDERRVAQLEVVSEQVEVWASRQIWNRERPDPQAVLGAVQRMVIAKQHVDRLLDDTLSLRTGFVKLSKAERRLALRQYLEFTSRVIDLSGRLRYFMRDVIDTAAFDLESDLTQLQRLIDLLAEHRVSMGADVMSYVLFDPPPGSDYRPFPRTVRVKVLRLISRAASTDLLPRLAEFVRQPANAPDLTVAAAEVIRRIGLPQDPIPDQDPTLPEPSIVGKELQTILRKLDTRRLTPEFQRYHGALTKWLDTRVRQGVTGEEIRVGDFKLRSGDWLLMRNPSPYNLFTDLSPGLFTHVGVVSAVRFEDGIRRFVIVDLPERGDHIPVTNVDMYLLRTLHYFFLRHEDPEVCRTMGDVASQLIGNPSVFDLSFRTDRVRELRGKPLKGARVHTYCAGFLLLCAQETKVERTEFFPIEEFTAGGHCAENLKKLGLSLGDGFVSPTGAVFSPRLEIVGRRKPMYSPDREVKEAVYDHFARSMVKHKLTPSPDALQALRQNVAELSRYNPWLARELAKANNVSEHMDLAAAAKASAAIETLDEFANGAANHFIKSRQALLAGPLDQLPAEQAKPANVQRIKQYRRRHADLYRRLADPGLSDPGLSPRQLRIALVDYYSQWGRQRIDERFFPDSKAASETK